MRAYVLFILFGHALGCSEFRQHHAVSMDDRKYLHLAEAFRVSSSIARMDRIVTSLLAREVTILAIGGSETAGMQCNDGLSTGKACAWPARLVHWLTERYPETKFRLENQAIGGTTTLSALPFLPSWLQLRPDLMLIDFAVNDAIDFQGDNLMAIQETLIRTILHHAPRLRMVHVVTCTVPVCQRAARVARQVSALYNIPCVSFPEVVSVASELSGRDMTDVFWDVGGPTVPVHHPLWTTHQLIADMVAHAWHSADPASCATGGVTPITPSSTDMLLCNPPATMHSAYSPSPRVNTGWPLTEDRAGKPGWISTGNGSWIIFPIKFGTTPRLMLTYLRSRTSLGTATMYFEDDPANKVILQGGHNKEGSQSFLHVFSAQRDGSFLTGDPTTDIVGFSTEPNSERLLRFEADGKFKIISVSAC